MKILYIFFLEYILEKKIINIDKLQEGKWLIKRRRKRRRKREREGEL